MTFLVVGATGNVGRHVVSGLLATGASVRTASRTPDGPPGVETVVLDLTDPTTFGPALHGARKVFLYARSEGAQAFAGAAREAGVEHVVLLSSATVEMVEVADSPIARFHAEAEAALVDSGLPWTFLRPSVFATNSLAWAPSIKAEGVVRLPYPQAQLALIHEADMAEVAVCALTEPGHERRAYRLSGAQSLTQRQQVEAIAAAIGRPIRLEELAPEQLAARMPAGLLQHLAASQAGPAPIEPAFEQVTGHPGRSFGQWAADHADDFR